MGLILAEDRRQCFKGTANNFENNFENLINPLFIKVMPVLYRTQVLLMFKLFSLRFEGVSL
jgi:hypothetical protein